MQGLRTFWRDHRRLAMLLLALTLGLKALIPAGYMLGEGSHVLTVEICADASGQRVTHQVVIPQDGRKGQMDQSVKKATACPWSALAMTGAPGTDSVLLAGALAFVLALAFAPRSAAHLASWRHSRPPLRGPPILS